jgi:hypothetical protein
LSWAKLQGRISIYQGRSDPGWYGLWCCSLLEVVVRCRPRGEEEAGWQPRADGNILVVVVAGDLDPGVVVVFPPLRVVLRRDPSGAAWWLTAMGDADTHLHGIDAMLISICKILCGIADEPGEILSPTLRRCW